MQCLTSWLPIKTKQCFNHDHERDETGEMQCLTSWLPIQKTQCFNHDHERGETGEMQCLISRLPIPPPNNVLIMVITNQMTQINPYHSSKHLTHTQITITTLIKSPVLSPDFLSEECLLRKMRWALDMHKWKQDSQAIQTFVTLRSCKKWPTVVASCLLLA